MQSLLYVTGNKIKFSQAIQACSPLGIELHQTLLDIPEIQAESGESVARDKATKAFAELGKPLVVSDDSWVIPGLKGFPGPYMKYINDWFTPEDWLRLTANLADRRIIMHQIVAYQDKGQQKLFTAEFEGVLLHEARGESPYAHAYITSFDNGKTSNAEHHTNGKSAAGHMRGAWHDFAEWYIKAGV